MNDGKGLKYMRKVLNSFPVRGSVIGMKVTHMRWGRERDVITSTEQTRDVLHLNSSCICFEVASNYHDSVISSG